MSLSGSPLQRGRATVAEILEGLLDVDGAGSGLDADLLDGNHASAFATSAQGDLADTALQPGDIGVVVQGWDADLDTWATVTPSANGQSLVSAANYATMRGLLDLEAGTDFYSISAADALFALKLSLSGGTMTGDLVFSDGASLNRAHTRQASPQSTSGASQTITLNFDNGDWFPVTIAHATPTIAISNLPTGHVTGIVLELINGGSQVVTWPTGTQWAGGVAPTLTSSGTDLIAFWRDGDGTLRATVLGYNFSAP